MFTSWHLQVSTPWPPDDIVLSLVNIIPILLKYFYHKYFLIIHFSIVSVVSIFFKKKIMKMRKQYHSITVSTFICFLVKLHVGYQIFYHATQHFQWFWISLSSQRWESCPVWETSRHNSVYTGRREVSPAGIIQKHPARALSPSALPYASPSSFSSADPRTWTSWLLTTAQSHCPSYAY